MQNVTSRLKIGVFSAIFLLLTGFMPAHEVDEHTGYLQTALNKYHDLQALPGQLKRIELNVTNTGFCRYRKFFTNGKVEFHAMNLRRLQDVSYLGNIISGKLLLTTVDDDVIVQTYNDKTGNVDTMARSMVIPLKAIDVEELNILRVHLQTTRNLLLK